MSVSGFVSRAACRGRRPQHLISLVSHSRPALVAQLLTNRNVARCIVAPSGYGKSTLAAEYVETVSSWEHAFWFNAKSPCFVRDLDAAQIASSCRAFDPQISIVVFDDLPELEVDRQQLLSQEIDKLLDKGCEVIITCVPSCDSLGSFQRDRLRLAASELLLDDDEVDNLRSADDRSRKPVSQIGKAQRVPVLAWGISPERSARFVEGVLREPLPSDLLLAAASAFVLQKGSFDDLMHFVRFDKQALQEIARDYPHFDFDSVAESFEAPLLDIAAVAPALKKRLPGFVGHSSFGSSVKLVHAWATSLIEAGQPARACELVRETCPRRSHTRWVLVNAEALVRQACFFPLFRLVTNYVDADSQDRAQLDALEAACRRVLGDDEGALRVARRNAFDVETLDSARVISQLVIATLGESSAVERASAELCAHAEVSSTQLIAKRSVWDLIAQTWCESTRGISDMCLWWKILADNHVPDNLLLLATSWLFGLCEGSGEELGVETHAILTQAEHYLRGVLVDEVACGKVNYLAASAGLSLEAAHVRGMEYRTGSLPAGVLVALRQVEMNILSQRRQFEEDSKLENSRHQDWNATHQTITLHVAPYASQTELNQNVPLLTLRLFGCFEASIGGNPVDYSLFRRQNTRALLVLLAVNQGRELSRELVAEAMWPQSSGEVAAKNFYTVWSNLRRVLSLPDGTCPYLIRRQSGCSLDERYVQSDVSRLDDICRELLFSTPNITRWSTLFSEIDKDFSGDLMPSESKNALVIQARNDYRTRLVDALVAATVSVIGTENAQWGVWLARAAVGRDATREDAYFALMRAQIAVNQRTAAMMTYLQCRRALSEHLGIDPSPETTELYESLLD